MAEIFSNLNVEVIEAKNKNRIELSKLLCDAQISILYGSIFQLADAVRNFSVPISFWSQQGG
jgi:hypothetical protein